MTPVQLSALALALLEFEEWLAEDVSDTIEQHACRYLRDVVLYQRRLLIAKGAR